ncbi:MAG: pyridoxal 5'-phosphate synthase glutaminase subunit PdxT [Deltaproteobacteria bacterium]|nr:pyridoxal 5'-phosphate synthase glutaminase subunit PdxT [Deltaproteobacteria bacterium]
MNVGVLALQGAFREHIRMIHSCGAAATEVRLPDQLSEIDGLIIPGGESTTISKLLIKYDFPGEIKKMALSGKPVFGTCAGAILMAARIDGNRNSLLNLIDIDISRNAYGRQINSREAEVKVTASTPFLFNAVFIRAPVINHTEPDVTVLGTYNGKAVLARQHNVLVCTFHPELTDDSRIHQYYLNMINKGRNNYRHVTEPITELQSPR